MGLVRKIKHHLKQNLQKDRYKHTLRVRRTALDLIEGHVRFSSDQAKKKFRRKVSLAALLHDVDKGTDPAQLWLKLQGDPQVRLDDIKDSREIWHAFSAALTATAEFGITDPEILDALRYHSTGRMGMTTLDKIIYLADYIEPGRDFPQVAEIRTAATGGINCGCLCALEHSIAHLKTKGVKISPYTIEARKDLLDHGIFRTHPSKIK